MKKLQLTTVLMASFWLFSLTVSAADCEKNFLSRDGNKLVDSKGNQVQLTGVNWFGFETAMGFFHGIWSRDHKSMLQQIKDQGFNCIRIPWNNAILDQDISGKINTYGTDPYTGVSPMNVEESKLSKPIELLDITIKWCQENNMKVILDNHSREPDGYMVEGLWYTKKVSHEKWIEDWVFMAKRYKNYDAVIAMDINNEPHGAYGAGARWGTGDPANDWRLAAQECGNAILAVHPDVLVMVEGTEEFEETSYWWGGNLQGAKDYPVVLTNPNKLVYSPHEYGPTVHNQSWFSDPSFPNNMAGIWEKNFNYLYTNGTSPMFFGEFGIREAGGKDEIWFDELLKFMAQKGHHWTFWCWNPNSGDTGGLLDNQWKTVVEWKMAKLRPHLAAEIPNCTSSETINVTGVALTPSVVSINKGNNATLSATVSPSNASNKSVSWTTSNSSVASVSSTGIVTAISEGTTTITVTTEDGSFTSVCSVTVTNDNTTVNVDGISLSPTTLTLKVGNTSTLTASISPANATNKSVTWSSENNAVASVNSAGIVSAVAEGTTSITLTSVDGNFTATCSITVEKNNTGGGTICDFGTPANNPLPTVHAIYKYVFIDGSGPDLSSVKDLTINWDLDNNGLWQFSINTNNGTPSWWLDLKSLSTYNFNESEPSVSLSKTGIIGLDGDYYVTIDNGNFIMAEKTGTYTIIFTKEDVAPCAGLKRATSFHKDNQLTGINVYPNPFQNKINIDLSNFTNVQNISIFNTMGQLVNKVEGSEISKITSIKLDQPNAVYYLQITADEGIMVKSILKK